MKELPLISVIVPVYKVEAYLSQCIRSITEQTYQNLEIILVDDGSPDQSGAICDAWAEKDSRIRVIHKENNGAGAARNTGLDVATGELLAFVDSDDYIAPDMYAHLYELMRCGADIAECGFVETNGDNVAFGGADETCQVVTPEEAMRGNIRDTVFRQLIWNKLYRRELTEGVRFPVGQKIDDEFYTYQLLGKAKQLVRSERICYAYRQQENSVMHERFSIKRVEGLRAKQQRLCYLKLYMPQLEAEAREELLFSCLYAMQASLRSLEGAQLQKAKDMIRSAAKDAIPVPFREGRSRLRSVLLKLAQKDLELSSRLLNFLIDIHILT